MRTGELSDHDLLDGIRAGDDGAHRELWARHYDIAVRAARLFADDGSAEKIATDGFTRLLAAMRNGRQPVAAFRPYLLRTVANLALISTRRGRQIHLADTGASLDTVVPTAEPDLDGAYRSVTVRAYQRLRPAYRHILWYVEVEGLTPAQAAPFLGLTAGAAKNLANRARDDLRREFMQVDVDAGAEPSPASTVERLGGYVRGPFRSRDRHRVELTTVTQSLRAGLVPLVLGTGRIGTEWLTAPGPPVAGASPAGARTTPETQASTEAPATPEPEISADTAPPTAPRSPAVPPAPAVPFPTAPLPSAPLPAGPRPPVTESSRSAAPAPAVPPARRHEPAARRHEVEARPRVRRERRMAGARPAAAAPSSSGRGALVAAVGVALTAIAATALAAGSISTDVSDNVPAALPSIARPSTDLRPAVRPASSTTDGWLLGAIMSPSPTPGSPRGVDEHSDSDRAPAPAGPGAPESPVPDDRRQGDGATPQPPWSPHLPTPGPTTPVPSPPPPPWPWPPPGTPHPTPTPTDDPTEDPSPTPTDSPTDDPSPTPTDSPTDDPSPTPTDDPTDDPSPTPTDDPTDDPSPTPTDDPSPSPTSTADPTGEPTAEPTGEPTGEPTSTGEPTPTGEPTDVP